MVTEVITPGAVFVDKDQWVWLEVIPAAGMVLNLRGGALKKYDGQYQVTGAGRVEWFEQEYPKLELERIGDIPEDKNTLCPHHVIC